MKERLIYYVSKNQLIETIKIEDKFKVFEEIIDFNLFDDQNKTIQ